MHRIKKSDFAIMSLTLLILLQSCITRKPDIRLPEIENSILLSNTRGKISGLALDTVGHRLFISDLDNNTVLSVNLLTHSDSVIIDGFNGPQDILYLTAPNRLFVVSGGDGTVKIYNGDSYDLIKTITLESGADHLYYDPVKNKLYVGYGHGAIAIIDNESLELEGTVPLPAHPQSLVTDKSGDRMFVNIPSEREIAVVDLNGRQLIKNIKTENRGNFPIGIDTVNSYLLVGFRQPSVLSILNKETGNSVASLQCNNGASDIFFDTGTGLVYLTAESGFIDIFKQMNANHFMYGGSQTTHGRINASLFEPGSGKMYIATHSIEEGESYIDIYNLNPGE